MHILKELGTKEIEMPEVTNSYQYVFGLIEKLEDTLALAKRSLRELRPRESTITIAKPDLVL